MGLFSFFKRNKADINQYASIHGNYRSVKESHNPFALTEEDCRQLAIQLHEENNDQLLEGYRYSFSSMFDQEGKFDLALAVSVIKRKIPDWKMVYKYNGISFKDFILLGEIGSLEMYNEALTAHNQALYEKMVETMESSRAQTSPFIDMNQKFSNSISTFTDEQVRRNAVETSHRFAEMEKKREQEDFEKWAGKLAYDLHEKYPQIEIVTLYSRIVDLIHVLEASVTSLDKEFDYRKLSLDAQNRLLNDWCSKDENFRNQVRVRLETRKNKKL